MKITKKQLTKIIQQEAQRYRTSYKSSHEEKADAGLADGPDVDIEDAIQMLEAEPDPEGTLFHVINRLGAALEKLR